MGEGEVVFLLCFALLCFLLMCYNFVLFLLFYFFAPGWILI